MAILLPHYRKPWTRHACAHRRNAIFTLHISKRESRSHKNGNLWVSTHGGLVLSKHALHIHIPTHAVKRQVYFPDWHSAGGWLIIHDAMFVSLIAKLSWSLAHISIAAVSLFPCFNFSIKSKCTASSLGSTCCLGKSSSVPPSRPLQIQYAIVTREMNTPLSLKISSCICDCFSPACPISK